MVDLLKNQVITDKSLKLLKSNKYTFDVDVSCTKKHIIELIETLFDVKVLRINTFIISPKRRRLGKFKGFKNCHKRVILTLNSTELFSYFSKL